MEYTLPTSSGMQLVASGSRSLPSALSERLALAWAKVREGEESERGLSGALREEVLGLCAFQFKGALWILAGDHLEQIDQDAKSLKSVLHPVSDVLEGELAQRLSRAWLEPAFVLDERRALWFLKGTVDNEQVAFPVVFDAAPLAESRWQVLYPDLELTPHDWRIAAGEPRALFATDDEDTFELRGMVGTSALPPVTTHWTLRLARGRYHFGETRARRARPALLSTTTMAGVAGRARALCFSLARTGAGAPVIHASRRGGEAPILWFKPYDRELTGLSEGLCRGSVQGDEAITLDVTSPDALTVRYWRSPR